MDIAIAAFGGEQMFPGRAFMWSAGRTTPPVSRELALLEHMRLFREIGTLWLKRIVADEANW